TRTLSMSAKQARGGTDDRILTTSGDWKSAGYRHFAISPVAAFDPLQTLAPLLGLWCRGAVRVHFHLPKPLHGWRQFVGEVGIIVVGVLIALSAEQLVETMHWHHAVDAARNSLSDEIEEKDYDAAELAIAPPCIDPHLRLLEKAVLAPGPYQPVPAYSEGAMTLAFRAPSRPWSN